METAALAFYASSHSLECASAVPALEVPADEIWQVLLFYRFLQYPQVHLCMFQFFELMRSLGKDVAATIRGYGVDTTGTGKAYIMRDIARINAAEGSFQLSGPPLPVGSLFRLHAYDPEHAQEQIHRQLQVFTLLLERLPAAFCMLT